MSSTTEDNNDNQLCGGGGGHGSREIISSKNDECISCEQNNVDNITEGIDSIAILNDVSKCASCGKEGNSDDMNTCNKCKMVKYCNAACKKKHRKKHKKKCEERVAQLHDEQLFKEPPPREECPICMLPLPFMGQTTFQSCCGKLICNGCMCTILESEGKDLCPFCRVPYAKITNDEHIKQTKNLIMSGNAEAYNKLANSYAHGIHGMPQNYRKANELLLKAGELGCAEAYHNLGVNYSGYRGAEVDMNKAKYYWELAAMGGQVVARHNLGCLEGHAGNNERAKKHFIIAARGGYKESLDMVKVGFMHGDVTKDEYANTLRAHQQRLDEMKSDARDKAAEVYGP